MYSPDRYIPLSQMKLDVVNQHVVQIASRCTTTLNNLSELIDLSSVVGTLPPCISELSDDHSLSLEEFVENINDDAQRLIRIYEDTKPNGLLHDTVPMLILDTHACFVHIQHQATLAIREIDLMKVEIRAIFPNEIPQFARAQSKFIMSKWKQVFRDMKYISATAEVLFDDVNTTLGYTAITRIAIEQPQ